MNTFIINSRVSLDALNIFVQDSFQKIIKQEKILQIAGIALGCLTLLYLTYRYCYFYSKQVKPYKKGDTVGSVTNSLNHNILDLESRIERSKAILKYLTKQPDSPEKELIKNSEKNAISKCEELIAALDPLKAKTFKGESDDSVGSTSEKKGSIISPLNQMNMTGVLSSIKKGNALKSPGSTATPTPKVKPSTDSISKTGVNDIVSAIKAGPKLRKVNLQVDNKSTENPKPEQNKLDTITLLKDSPLFQKIIKANDHSQDFSTDSDTASESGSESEDWL